MPASSPFRSDPERILSVSGNWRLSMVLGRLSCCARVPATSPDADSTQSRKPLTVQPLTIYH